MRLVVVHREDKFNEVLRRIRNNGGHDATAYRKIGGPADGVREGFGVVCE